MSTRDKQKVKSRLTILGFAMFGLFIGWISDASAFPSYFDSIAAGGKGCSDAGCHDGAAVIPTCNGCHGHGAHSDSNKGVAPAAADMNITATTDTSSYNVGDTIAITVDGGYKTAWARVSVYDDSGTEIAKSSGTCDSTTSTNGATPACANGLAMPIILQVTASSTGTQMWTAAWYGHEFDATGSTGGINDPSPSTGVTDPGWLASTANPNHGEEIVSIAAFTVNSAPTTTTSSGGGGGGSLSWFVLGLLLFVFIGMLVKDRQARMMPIKLRKID